MDFRSGVFATILIFLFSTLVLEAYDSFDPNGNITVQWDVSDWSSDGYIATVTLFNYQQYRHIEAPGWKLGWMWARKEIIWSMKGGETTEQGDCSKFRGYIIPHCCKRDPNLLPGTAYNQQIANCCKGGVVNSLVQDPGKAISSFQLSVGGTGTTVRLPKNFTLKTPGPGYTCGVAKIVEPSKFVSQDGRRVTQAIMTWKVTCTYSQFRAQNAPTCCVSLSAFYTDTIVPCQKCSCGCQKNRDCVDRDEPQQAWGFGKDNNSPMIGCTSHMCPIRIHWHVKFNYKEYWRVKVTITNFNYNVNHTQWNLVVQHPNFNNLAQLFSFSYKSLSPYGTKINDTAMLWGKELYNNVLMQAGPLGNVQSELLFAKDSSTLFSFKNGWAFPQTVYFNRDYCVIPQPDSYPSLPNGSSKRVASLFMTYNVFILVLGLLIT